MKKERSMPHFVQNSLFEIGWGALALFFPLSRRAGPNELSLTLSLSVSALTGAMPRSNGEATAAAAAAAAGGGAVEAGAVEDIVAADDGAMPTEETSGPAAALSASSSLKQRDDPHLVSGLERS